MPDLDKLRPRAPCRNRTRERGRPARAFVGTKRAWKEKGGRDARAPSLPSRHLPRRQPQFRENFLIVLADRGRRRVDARAVMGEAEGRDRHPETALDARGGSVAVDNAAARD